MRRIRIDRNALDRAMHPGGRAPDETREEVRGQSGKSARRSRKGGTGHENVQAKKEVLAEAPVGDGFREVGVGERHEARIHAKRSVPPSRSKCALRERARAWPACRERARRLRRARWCRPGHFQAAGLARDSAGERATLVAKKLGFDQFAGRLAQSIFRKGASRRGPCSWIQRAS